MHAAHHHLRLPQPSARINEAAKGAPFLGVIEQFKVGSRRHERRRARKRQRMGKGKDPRVCLSGKNSP